MFAFTFLCISFLVSLVHASPLGLRSVFSPHITSPNEKSVWPVGTKQFVTWETDNIPPDSELTNPNGKVVLGHLGSDGGLNLDIDHPLAQNFKLRVGKIQVTVPNVAPREDYIVVLFGDSGNASPAFAITKITTGANVGTTTQGGGKATSVTDLTSLISTPIPITGSAITGGSSQATNTGEPTTDVPTWSTTDTSSVPTPTSPVPSSTSGTSSGTTAPATTPTNAASPFQATGWKVTAGLASAILALLI